MIIVIDNLYSDIECQELINDSEKLGYSERLTNKYGEQFTDKDFRSDYGVGNVNHLIANTLLERIRRFIPDVNVQINPLIRFSRYIENGYCVSHKDDEFVQSGYKSKYTVVVFLNTCVSGKLEFENVTINCKQGQVVIFNQGLSHEALKIDKDQIKYTMRTDIMVPYLMNTGSVSVESILHNHEKNPVNPVNPFRGSSYHGAKSRRGRD
jgi:hypothetical protein